AGTDRTWLTRFPSSCPMVAAYLQVHPARQALQRRTARRQRDERGYAESKVAQPFRVASAASVRRAEALRHGDRDDGVDVAASGRAVARVPNSPHSAKSRWQSESRSSRTASSRRQTGPVGHLVGEATKVRSLAKPEAGGGRAVSAGGQSSFRRAPGQQVEGRSQRSMSADGTAGASHSGYPVEARPDSRIDGHSL